VIVDAELRGRKVSVRLADRLVAELGDDVSPRPGDDVIDARGGALVPGLHDHHVHLRAALAAAGSVRLGPPEVTGPDELRRRLAKSASQARPWEWVRGVGYHESVSGLPDRWMLDEIAHHVPVRIQHRSGALWMLNSRGVDLLGLADVVDEAVERDQSGRPTGRIWRGDHLLRRADAPRDMDAGEFGVTEASYGVTGFTDASADNSDAHFRWIVDSTESGSLRTRVHVMRPIGSPLVRSGLVSTGPVKVLLDDQALPGLDELADIVAGAHGEGRKVAVHCVTRAQIVLTVAALKAAGSSGGDRIEHGSVVPRAIDRELLSLGAVVVTQPNFVDERGDRYLVEVDEEDLADLYRCGSLLEAGVSVAAGTDAPFGGADPWAAMRAAVERRTRAGSPLGCGERVAAMRALELFLGEADRPERQRTISPGAAADLCLLSAPLEAVLGDLSAEAVRMTIVGGSPVHGE